MQSSVALTLHCGPQRARECETQCISQTMNRQRCGFQQNFPWTLPTTHTSASPVSTPSSFEGSTSSTTHTRFKPHVISSLTHQEMRQDACTVYTIICTKLVSDLEVQHCCLFLSYVRCTNMNHCNISSFCCCETVL